MIKNLKEWTECLFKGIDKPEPAVPAPIAVPLPPLKEEMPDFVKMAMSHVGRSEAVDIAWIMGLFRYTSYPLKYVNKTTAWCAAGICMLMDLCKYKNTKSAAAKGQERLGNEKSRKLPYGVCVWLHLTGSLKGRRHTNIALEAPEGNETCLCVGYNQNNSVNTARYGAPNYKLESYREPVKL